jgi:YD repeat-containing protein
VCLRPPRPPQLNTANRAGRVLAFLPSYSSTDTFVCDALGRVTAWHSPAGDVQRAYNAPGLPHQCLARF